MLVASCLPAVAVLVVVIVAVAVVVVVVVAPLDLLYYYRTSGYIAQ